MVYQVNGNKGMYDSIINDESQKYGRNAVTNHIQHAQTPIKNDNFAVPPVVDLMPKSEEAFNKNVQALESYINKNDEYLKSLPPIEYEYRYMPNITNGKIDKKALIASAYEDMGKVKELPVEVFESRYLINDSQTAQALDINNDGKIDNSEYAANIIASDILSKGTTDPMKADGVINSKGMNAILEYSKKSNIDAARKLYTNIYNTHNLGSINNYI